MAAQETFQRPAPACPHCGHELNDEEMGFASQDDLWRLAIEGGAAVVECPICDQEYWVKGGYKPHYTSALAEEDL